MNANNYSEAPGSSTQSGPGTTATAAPETATQRAAAEIRGLMGARRLNAIDLRPVLKLSTTAVTRRFNGDADMSLDELEKIAQWLDVPITRLIAPAPGHTYST